MTERVRRRASKWDLQENSATFSIGTMHNDASVNKVTESIHENEAKPDWISKNTGSRTKWSDTNTDGGFKSEGNSRQQGWGPSSGNRAERNGDKVGMNVNEVSPNMKKWDENRSYSTSISPRRDDWRQESRSRSPRRGWSNSHRSRSRSPPHGLRKRSRSPPHGLRNRSRSPPHGLRNRSRSPPRGFRNRSRSPPHGLKRDPEGRTDRVRGESRVPLCNDFTKGRCMRGDQCRFLHEETNGYEGRRPSGSVEENWGSRHQGGSYGHANNVERDYSRDRVSHGHERDARSYSGPDQRREPYRTVIPCKYFASGNCRKGTSCRFSHEGAAHEQPQGGSNWRPEAAQGSVVGLPLNNVMGHTANNAWEASEWNKKLTNNEDKAVHGRPQARPANERWAHNVSDVNKSWGGSTWGDEATDPANGSVAGRPVNGGRDRISNSGWDNPAYNKTSVGWIPNDQALTDRPEGRSMEESLDHNMLDERKSHEGQKWGVEAAGSTNYTVEGGSVNDGRGQIANTSCGDARWMKQPTGSTWNDVAADSEVKKVPQWGNDGKSEQVGGVDANKLLGDGQWSNNASAPEVSKTPDWADNKKDDVKNVPTVPGPPQMSLGDRSYSLENKNQTWGVPTWSTNASESELAKAPEWGSVNEIKNDAAASCAMNRSVDVKTDYNLGDQNRTWGVSTWSNTPSDQDVHKATQISRGNGEVVSFTSQQSAGVEKEQYPHFIGNEKAGFGVQDPQSHAPMFSHGQYSTQGVASQQHNPIIPLYIDGEKHPATTAITHPTSSNMISQSQQPLLSSPVMRSFDLNGPVEDVPSPKHQSLFHMVETIKAGKVDPIVPPVPNAPIATQSTVTSEQVAQISHLSASLAQIFGNGQQLPQLYATLNSTSSVGLATPGPISGRVDAPVGGSFVQSNQDTWSQQQYGTVSSSMASSQISAQPQAFSEKPVHGNTTTNHEPQTQLQSSVLSSMTVGSNGSDPAINDNLQKTFQHGTVVKQLELVGNERAAEGIVKEQDNANARSGDTNADGRVDEDDKKSKETKAMRMFKFALVEFVKEILKPTWREGTLSKEAHKTIVKKVVDKVTGAVQGEHIPQTQEKIDQYMAYSKIKLTKLVEAYVEKYVKS